MKQQPLCLEKALAGRGRHVFPPRMAWGLVALPEVPAFRPRSFPSAAVKGTRLSFSALWYKEPTTKMQKQDRAPWRVPCCTVWHLRHHNKASVWGFGDRWRAGGRGRNRVSPFILLSWQQYAPCAVGRRKKKVVNGRINNNIKGYFPPCPLPPPSLLPLPPPPIQEADNKQGHLIHSLLDVNTVAQ